VKKAIHIAAVLLIVALLIDQPAHAQGTLYVSNFGPGIDGGYALGNNLWLAQGFETGPDAGGYVLNSVQLDMASATGNPSGFTLSIYSAGLNGSPSADLGILSGSANPSSSGVYTYTTSGLMLAPSTDYFIVATSATPTTQGYYMWVEDLFGAGYSSVDEWLILSVAGSSNGSAWTGLRAWGFETAIYATDVPEPSTWILCLLGSGLAFYFHKHKQRLTEV